VDARRFERRVSRRSSRTKARRRPVATVVRALVTTDALVFAIRCDYAPGVNVVTFARERDAH
jgi:hypothetical protein